MIKLSLAVTSILISLFSYLFVEHGLVSMLAAPHPFIGNLYSVINFRNGNRETLSMVYLLLLVSLFTLQIVLLLAKPWKLPTTKSLFLLAGFTTVIFSLGYPLFSNDFFAYLFSGKMILVYHVNPYQVAPERFIDKELWFSFLRNIEVTYPYGPVSLLYYLIPMFIFTPSKFLLNFFGIKLLSAAIFYLTGILIYKMIGKDNRIFSYWFFNPLLVIELLVNAHNDLLMIGLFVGSLFCLSQKRIIKAWILLAASVLTKYGSIFAVPLMFLNDRKKVYFFKLASLGVPLFLQLQTVRPVLPWYYTWAYMFLPFAKLRMRSWIIIHLMGLLLLVGYYPFIKFGGWIGTPLVPNPQVIFNLLLFSVVLLELGLQSSFRSEIAKTIFLIKRKK